MNDQPRARVPNTCAWTLAHVHPELPAGELHLWWVPLSAGDGVVDDLAALLSERERARADRFRFDRHRRAWILARGSLRRLLEGYTGTPARDLEFAIGPQGKPFLVDACGKTGLRFNYSDAGGYALYGFIRGAEIGVDLESLDREMSYEAIASSKFTSTEAAAILSLPGAQGKDAFLACWTRKEGYGKAEGWGITYPLDSVELCADCSVDRLVVDDGRSGKWALRQIYPTRSFVGCVVYPSALDDGDDLAFRFFGATPG